jgi:hypothetical protein
MTGSLTKRIESGNMTEGSTNRIGQTGSLVLFNAWGGTWGGTWGGAWDRRAFPFFDGGTKRVLGTGTESTTTRLGTSGEPLIETTTQRVAVDRDSITETTTKRITENPES